eukprot:1313297-Prymnesium_polylepis.1
MLTRAPVQGVRVLVHTMVEEESAEEKVVRLEAELLAAKKDAKPDTQVGVSEFLTRGSKTEK